MRSILDREAGAHANDVARGVAAADATIVVNIPEVRRVRNIRRTLPPVRSTVQNITYNFIILMILNLS